MIFGPMHSGNCRRLRALALLATLAFATNRAGACGLASGAGRIVRVTERLEIGFEDGRLLRLAGIDIPRFADGFDANEPARSRIGEKWAGRDVALFLLAPRPDRWGRWLADARSAEGGSLADDLLSAGLARVRPEFESRSCEEGRLALEAEARKSGRGMWNEPGSTYEAADLAGLAAADGRFAIVEGSVLRVGLGRSRVYLDFGRRGGFSVVVEKKIEPALRRRGLTLDALAGQSVRVRGVVENRFGTRIEIADPLMIERTEGDAPSRSGG